MSFSSPSNQQQELPEEIAPQPPQSLQHQQDGQMTEQQVDSEEDNKLNLRKGLVCDLHKRQVEFLCQYPDCEFNMKICNMCDLSLHSDHESFLVSKDKTSLKELSAEIAVIQAEKEFFSEKIDQIQEVLQRTLNNSNEGHSLLQLTKLFSEFNLLQQASIHQAAEATLSLLQRKEYSLSQLVGNLVSKHNIFEPKYKEKFAASVEAYLNGLGPTEITLDNQDWIDMHNQDIVCLTRVGEWELAICTQSTVLFYDFKEKKILARQAFANTEIQSIVRCRSKQVAMSLRQNQHLLVFFPLGVFFVVCEVIVLKRVGGKIKLTSVFKQDALSQPLDIIAIPTSHTLLVLTQFNDLYFFNIRSNKLIKKLEAYDQAELYEEGEQRYLEMKILSCTVVRNVEVNGVRYAFLLAMNASDGMYFLFDFNNENHSKNIVFKVKRGSRISFNYMKSTAWSVKGISRVIVLQGTRGEIYYQNVLTGQLEIRIGQISIEYFDWFEKNTAMPVYWKEQLFFVEMDTLQRLKSIELDYGYKKTVFQSQRYSSEMPKQRNAVLAKSATELKQQQQQRENENHEKPEKQEEVKNRFTEAWDQSLHEYNMSNQIESEEKNVVRLAIKMPRAKKENDTSRCSQGDSDDGEEVDDQKDHETGDGSCEDQGDQFEDIYGKLIKDVGIQEEEEDEELEEVEDRREYRDEEQYEAWEQEFDIWQAPSHQGAIPSTHNNNGLFHANAYPIAVINTNQFILVIYPNGDIQYIK